MFFVFAPLVALASFFLACSDGGGSGDPADLPDDPPAAAAEAAPDSAPAVAPYPTYVPEAPGIAVAVLIDRSTSMREPPPGSETPKNVLARDAVARVLEATAGHLRENPETPVKVGVYYFSTKVLTALPMAPYDSAAVRAALERTVAPSGFTAIGEAMEAARLELYHSGATRKYILVVTDGVNTTGVSPAEVAREIRDRSEGGVGMYFVAFDVDPAKFAFVEEAGGEVLPAAGGDQLREALSKVYRTKILAEAEDYGDGFAQPRDTARAAP
ncbi:MAG TPA: vWA domain-containing protein [Longimicrobium sp.]|nr:vWA domain-containing protein [Longimicrobium sp.]